jgi:hypothetical protein
MSEAAIQRTVIAHLQQRGIAGLVYVHVPNGGFRKATEAKILKGQGVRAGCPDLLLWSHGKAFALELKTEQGRVSPAQRRFLEDLQGAGVHVAVAAGLDAALRTLEAWRLLKGKAL